MKIWGQGEKEHVRKGDIIPGSLSKREHRWFESRGAPLILKESSEMIKVITKKYGSLTDEELRKLRKLTYRIGSYLRDGMDGRIDACFTEVAIAIDTKNSNKWVGWSVIERGNTKTDNYVFTFVTSAYRRKGVGKRLVKTVLGFADLKSVKAFLDERIARMFYKTMGAKDDSGYGRIYYGCILVLHLRMKKCY